jgi:methylenetetrahydrofolate--tRNA-(uracil-5-)-methyltransferase
MVCSNSFRSDDDERNAVGLLHWEMRAAGSLVMEMAARHRLPAGERWRWTGRPSHGT